MSAKAVNDVKKIDLRLDNTSGDPYKRFMAARSVAIRAAGKDAFMLAWRDQITGHFSPCVDKCERDIVESWEVYGKSHGADLWVDVDNGRYSFLFKSH